MVNLQRFQAHRTLFSKYFSSFPHGTCLLSDSRTYLALDEIYRQICALIPENATRRTASITHTTQMVNRAVTFCCARSKKPPPVGLPAMRLNNEVRAGPYSFAITNGTLLSFYSLHLLICLNSVGSCI